MPGDKRVLHPSGLIGISFTEEDHRYMDDNAVVYTSVTTLVHSGFEEFNAEAVAERKSTETGIPARQYLDEWERNRDNASRAGTRFHENCEHQILNQYELMHKPESENEKAAFRAAWYEVEKIKANFLNIEPEKLVFSPRFGVAGSIDLLAEKEGRYLIGDWKKVKELKREGFGGRKGNSLPTGNLPDCNYFHYALQLQIYEEILRLERYIPFDATVERWLFVYDEASQSIRHEQMPNFTREALLMLAFNATKANLEIVPF